VVHDQAKQNLVQRQVFDKERPWKQEDEISLGDKVLLKQEGHLKGKSRKLEPKWLGPYQIHKVNHPA
jgi:hypothetical protein